tara:strand:+ start:1611 stop:3071 length:1461 start_codon:yes stop_codon:yes gene_type:complete
MVNKKRLISLVIIASLSLFFFIANYNEKVINATITRQQLFVLETLALFTNTDDRLVELLATDNNQAWLHLAKHHADNDANTAYQLGQYFRLHEQINTAQLWYKVAIRQQHVEAKIALANIYFNLQQYADIKPLLLSLANHKAALEMLYELALQQGDLAFIQAYKSRLAQGESVQLYRELAQYDVFRSSVAQRQSKEKTEQRVIEVSEKNTLKNSACLLDVQLFATNLTGLRHGQQLISAFEHHILAKHICLQPVKYIAANVLNCQHLVTEKISCNATVWMNRKDITTRYLGVIVEQGGANVDNGIMYLDQNDDLDVLVHELSHFIGFVDEYPLPKQHQKCQQFQQTPFAHNIVVLADYYQGDREKVRENILSQVPWRSLINDSTPILSKYQQGWKLATPMAYQDKVGVFTAAACNNQNEIQAFKPLAQRTKLQYFALFFPKNYIDIMLLAPNLYLMPSYHFNVSRDLAEQGKYHKAREVLQATLFD